MQDNQEPLWKRVTLWFAKKWFWVMVMVPFLVLWAAVLHGIVDEFNAYTNNEIYALTLKGVAYTTERAIFGQVVTVTGFLQYLMGNCKKDKVEAPLVVPQVLINLEKACQHKCYFTSSQQKLTEIFKKNLQKGDDCNKDITDFFTKFNADLEGYFTNYDTQQAKDYYLGKVNNALIHDCNNIVTSIADKLSEINSYVQKKVENHGDRAKQNSNWKDIVAMFKFD